MPMFPVRLGPSTAFACEPAAVVSEGRAKVLSTVTESWLFEGRLEIGPENKDVNPPTLRTGAPLELDPSEFKPTAAVENGAES